MEVEILWPELSEVMPLSENETRLFAVVVDESRVHGDELLATLSAEERQRAERFQLEKPRRQFVVGRLAVRTLLGKYLNTAPADIAIHCDAHGKPRIEEYKHSRELCFNLAHSDDLVLVAIASGCEVGVDVERIRNVSHLEEIAARYFHPVEVEEVFSAPPASRNIAFLQCWTAKEALAKAIGSGLSESLASFQVPVQNCQSTWIDVPRMTGRTSRKCWLEPLRPSPDYVAAVACLEEKRSISCFAFRL